MRYSSVDASVSSLSVTRHYKFFEVSCVFLVLVLVAREEAHQLPCNKNYLHYELLCFCITFVYLSLSFTQPVNGCAPVCQQGTKTIARLVELS